MTQISEHTGLSMIGDTLAELRKSKGWTQNAIAKKMNVNPKLISDFELNKRRLHHDLVIRYAKVLNVSADEILGTKPTQANESPVSRRLHQRLKKLETLPKSEQTFVLRVLDRLLSGKA